MSANPLQHLKQIELANEFKNTDDLFVDEAGLSSSEELEISYIKQSSVQSNHSTHSLKPEQSAILDTADIELHSDSSYSSSHCEEDEDSKMMELPQIRISLSECPCSPNYTRKKFKVKYSPIKSRENSLQEKDTTPITYTKYDKYDIVQTVDECTANAMRYEQGIFACITCSRFDYWKRFGLYFSVGLFICSTIALLLTVYMNSIWKYSSIFLIFLPLIIFYCFVHRLSSKYNSLKYKIPETTPSIELLACYKDTEIRQNVITTLNEERHFQFDVEQNIIHTYDAGYSSFAALNTVLSSIYDNSLFIRFPSKPYNVSLYGMLRLIQERIIHDHAVYIVRFPKIKLKVQIIKNHQMGLEKFKALIQQTGTNAARARSHENEDRVEAMHNRYIRTYFVAQFNKQPLFYCDKKMYGYLQRMTKWVSHSNYFSPIVGCHVDENEEMHALVADVNPDYGSYFVPVARMYQAIKYRDHHGKCGGLLKIEAHSIV